MDSFAHVAHLYSPHCLCCFLFRGGKKLGNLLAASTQPQTTLSGAPFQPSVHPYPNLSHGAGSEAVPR